MGCSNSKFRYNFCNLCGKKLDDNYFICRLYNEILFRCCSVYCYKEAFANLESEDINLLNSCCIYSIKSKQ